ncbi:MAG: GntG family PLP-dependent aldolase [bacterium]|nr:GntG family PLP-dependent aldolase [bacterium]
MIDLRSDTLTVPDQGMREAMASAQVGDDVYGEDPTVNALQERIAAMFGKESAIFVPSGLMGNQICLALHTQTGDEVIAEADAHIMHFENAGASVIARVQLNTIKSSDGCMSLDEIREAIRPAIYYYARTSLIALENSHNRHGGTVLPLRYMQSVRALANAASIKMHCDAARLWNALVALQCSPADVAENFDTLSICMSKGAGAPIGSLIIGSNEDILRARKWRKMLGGGMRQAGILAAACMYALDTIVPNIGQDHRRALMFADKLAHIEGISIERWRVQTNIVCFSVGGFTDADFVQACSAKGLRLAPIRRGVLRAVFYHQITDSQVAEAAVIVRSVLAERH